jgi:AMP-activated protein kinase-like protein
MKPITKLLAGLVFGLILTAAATAQSQNLILEAGGLKEAGPPRLFGDSILLSYQFPGSGRQGQIHTVQASFEHESYSRLHPFSVNESGLYILIVSIPMEVTALHYRLVVDGVWTIDPRAPSEITDRWGVRISEFQIPANRGGTRDYPAVSPEGFVEFRVLSNSGRSVALVGSFNGWDPFMTPMTETEPGLYSRVVRLPEGEHLYYYMIDGLRLPDPGNALRRWNVDGMAVSVVRLP